MTVNIVRRDLDPALFGKVLIRVPVARHDIEWVDVPSRALQVKLALCAEIEKAVALLCLQPTVQGTINLAVVADNVHLSGTLYAEGKHEMYALQKVCDSLRFAADMLSIMMRCAPKSRYSGVYTIHAQPES